MGRRGISYSKGQQSPAAPIPQIYRALQRTSRMLGRFPQGHALAGQQRLIVLKVNENFSSQIPSCWSTGHGANLRPIPQLTPPHPNLPNAVPPMNDRLQAVDDLFAVKKCPHCDTKWQRDVNACRYVIIITINVYYIEILVLFMRIFEA